MTRSGHLPPASVTASTATRGLFSNRAGERVGGRSVRAAACIARREHSPRLLYKMASAAMDARSSTPVLRVLGRFMVGSPQGIAPPEATRPQIFLAPRSAYELTGEASASLIVRPGYDSNG
jgi:hypothetical protein